MFSRLPFDVLCLILWKLPPEDVVQASGVNKAFYKILNNEHFWKMKLMQHFPVTSFRYPELDHLTSSYKKFKFVYEREYEGLSQRQRKILSVLKEGDIVALKKLIITVDDIAFMLAANNQHNITLNKCLKQSVMDYLFNDIILAKYSSEQLFKVRKLIWAIRLNQVKLISELMRHEPDAAFSLNYRDTQLHYAAMTGSVDIYQMVENQASYRTGEMNDTPLTRAIRYRNVQLVKHILLTKISFADEDFPHARAVAFVCGCVDFIEMIDNKYFELTQKPYDISNYLSYAAGQGNNEVVEFLLTALTSRAHMYFYKPQRSGARACDVALYNAVKGKFTDLVTTLLDRGANPAIVTDYGYYTPLEWAIRQSNTATIEVLLLYNAHLSLPAGVLAASLSLAIQQKDLDIALMLLIRSTASANTEDMHDFLYQAVAADREDIVSALLDYGVKPDVLLRKKSCLTAAASNRNERMVIRLLTHGANAHTAKFIPTNDAT